MTSWRGSRRLSSWSATSKADQFAGFEHALSYDHYAFLPENARFTLCEHFEVKSLDGFGCSELPQAIAAAGAIIHYLKHQLRRKIDHLTALRCEAPTDHVMLDAATQANLELVKSRGVRDTSLLAALGPNRDTDGRAEAAQLDPTTDSQSGGARFTSTIY